MANFFSIADGSFTEAGVFGRTIDKADVTYGTSRFPISPTLTNIIPFYVGADSYPIYGVAVNLYSRSASPTGSLTLSLSGSTGTIFTEQYSVSSFTGFDGTNNLITVHPQNWQILKLSTPLAIPSAGSYTLSLSASNANEIDLIGTYSGIDVANNTEILLDGTVSNKTPFKNSAEQSVQGAATSKIGLPIQALNEEDFTVEGYFYFNSFFQQWSPLVNLGDGWGNSKFASWGLSYNSTEQRIYFWRSSFGTSARSAVTRVFYAKYTVPIGEWVHIAASRVGSRLSIWVNGVCVGIQTNNSTSYAYIKKQKIKIGQFIKDSVTYFSDMYVSNVRVTRGISRYNPNFNLIAEPLSLRINTPFLYQSPYGENYIAADSSFTEKPFDVDATVLNTVDELRFVKTGSSSSSLDSNTPFGPGSPEFSLKFTGTAVYTAGTSYGNFTTGDFVVESWVNPSATSTTNVIAVYSSQFSLTNAGFYLFSLEIQNGFLAGWVASGTTKYNVIDSTAVTLNAWTHVALVRQNLTLKLFVNGVMVDSKSIPNKLNSITSPSLPTLVIGGERNNTKNFIGLISNLRFNQGTALYTSNFDTVPPTNGANIASPAPLTAIKDNLDTVGTVLIQPLVFDVSAPADNYTSSVTFVTDPDSPFVGGGVENSFSFVRSQSDYILTSLSRDSVANIGDTDFTIESWVKLNSLPTSEVYPNTFSLIRVGSASSNDGYAIFIGKTKIFLLGYNDTVRVSYDHNMSISTWYHVAAVRYKGNVTIYINGVATGATMPFEATDNSYFLNESTSYIWVGTETNQGSFFDGKITNLRVTRGTALYTSNFDVTPVTNGANIGSPAPLSPVNVGVGRGIYRTRNVAVPSSNVPHLGINSSLFFDGTFNHSVPADTNIGAANFTLEFWIDPVKDQYNGIVADLQGNGGGTWLRIAIGDEGAADTKLVVTGVGKTFVSSPLAKGSWSHVALVREDKTFKLYINGNLIDSNTSATIVLRDATNIISVGNARNNTNHTRGLYGYLADFRFTPGQALYPGNSFPTTSDVSSLATFPAGELQVPVTALSYRTPTFSAEYPSHFITPSGSIDFTYGSRISTDKVVSLSTTYTIEFWMKLNNTSFPGNLPGPYTRDYIIYSTGSWGIGIWHHGGPGRLYFSDWVPGSSWSYATVPLLPRAGWFHVSICRDGANFNMSIDGVIVPTAMGGGTLSGLLKDFNPTSPVVVGDGYGSRQISDLRILKNEAKYIGAPGTTITVPTDSFAASEPNTEYLLKPPYFNNTKFAANDSYVFLGGINEYNKLTTSNGLELPTIDRDTSWVMECWIKPERPSIQTEWWVYTDHIQIGINHYSAGLAAANDRRAWVYDAYSTSSTGDYALSTNRCIRYRSWNHIAVVFTVDSTSGSPVATGALYVNGNLEATWNRSYSSNLLYNLTVGTRTANTYSAYGGFNSLHIYTGDFPNYGASIFQGYVPTSAPLLTSNSILLIKHPFTYYTKNKTESIHFSSSASPFPSLASTTNTGILFNRNITSRIRRKHIDDSLRQNTPFTVEGWFNITEDSTDNSSVLSIWRSNDTGNYYQIATVGMRLVFIVNTQGEEIRSSIPILTNKWYYFALTQDSSNVVRLYMSEDNNGVAKFAGSYISSFNIASTIHNTDSFIGEGVVGYLSNIRESKDAIYTDDSDVSYTVSPLLVDDNTISLIQEPYTDREYSYRETVNSLLLKENSTIASPDSPFSGVDGSINQSYAIIPADFNPDLNLGSKTFTLEWWDKINGFTTDGFFPIIQLGSVTTSGDVLSVRYFKSGTIIKLLVRCNGSQFEYIMPRSFALNTWKHCALVRLDDIINLYIDGLFIAKITIGQLVFNSITGLSIIGAFYNSSATSFSALRTIKGNISNLRLVIDQNIYPEASVPSLPLDNIPGTALLYKAPYTSYLSNGAVGTVALADVVSPLQFVPTPSSTDPAEDCMLFYKGNTLRITDVGSTYNIGTGNQPFTLECWLFALTNVGHQSIISRGGGNTGVSTFGLGFELALTGNTLRWYGTMGSNSYFYIDYPLFGTRHLLKWVHVAVTFDGTTTRLHVNGVEEVTRSATHTYNYNIKNKGVFKLGDSHAYNNVASPHQYFGYISNVRIVKGDNLYGAASFTPQERLTSVPGTVLLLQSPYNNNVEFKFQTSPFGENVQDSLPFIDGKKSLKTAAAMPVLAGDFTIEFWFYCLRGKYFNTSIKESVLEGRASGTSTTPFTVRFNDTPGKISVYTGSAITPDNRTHIEVGDIIPKRWSHFAITRKNNNVNLYQDGKLVGSFFSSAAWGGNQLIIGRQHAGLGYGENNFFGYLSNIRIIDGEVYYGNIYDVFANPLTGDANTVFLMKVGANINKAVITMDSPPVGDEILPTILNDAEDNSTKENNPWGGPERDYFVTGYDHRVRIGPSNSLEVAQTSFSLEMWIKRTIDISCERTTQYVYSGNVTLAINCDSFLYFYSSNGWNNTGIEMPLNEWVHIAVVCDLTDGTEQIHIYGDGERMWTGSASAIPSNIRGTKTSMFGTTLSETANGASYYYVGYLSNVRLVRSDLNRSVIDDTGRFNIIPLKTYTVADSPNPSLSTSIFFSGQSSTYFYSTNRSCELPGKFTIEAYIKADLTRIGAGEELFYNPGNWVVYIYTNGRLAFGYRTSTNATNTLYTPAAVIPTDEWVHIAIVRDSSNNITIYANNLAVASLVESRPIGLSTNKTFRVGYPDTRFYLCGLRVNNAECLYEDPEITPPFPLTQNSSNVVMMLRSGALNTVVLPYKSDFTPPTGPLDAIPGTVFLLKAPYNVDVNNTIYTAFNVDVVPAANPHTLSSAYKFSGRWESLWSAPTMGGEYLTAHIENVHTAADDFTFETWIKPDKRSTQPLPQTYFSYPWWWNWKRTFDTYYRGWRAIAIRASVFGVYLNPTNNLVVTTHTGTRLTSSAVIVEEQWSHIAVVYSGANKKITLFVNGVVVSTFAYTATMGNTADRRLFIGHAGTTYQTHDYWNCADPFSCTSHNMVSYPFYGLMSDIQMHTRQNFATNITVENKSLSLASGTTFLYRSPYDVYNYETSGGLTPLVINNIIPDDTDGIFFPNNAAKYIKTQPLPSMSGDFLIEIWFKSTRTTTPQEMLIDARGSNVVMPWYLMINRTATRNITFNFGSVGIDTPANAFKLGVWTNVAVIRKQGFITMYVDGVPINTVQSTATWPSRSIFLGRNWEGKSPFQGYIHSVRVVKDNIVYSSAFDPTTRGRVTHYNKATLTTSEPLFAGANVTDATGVTTRTAVLRFDAKNASSCLYPVSPVGSTNSHMYFYYNEGMIIPANERMNLSGVPWSFEVWVYLTSASTSHRKAIIRKGDGANFSYAVVCNTDNTITFSAMGATINPTTGITTAVAIPAVTNSTRIPPFKWVHLMLASDGNNTELFIDGKYNFTYPYAPQFDNDLPLHIGLDNTSSPARFVGYMSNLRLIRNENAFATGIEVPTTQFPEDIAEDPDFDKVSLLLHGNGPDDSTVVTDSSSFLVPITASGNCRIRTITNKFGFASIYFGGTGDFLSGGAAFNNAGKFTDDFTVEFWVYAESAPQNDHTIISFNSFPTSRSGFFVRYRTRTLEVCSGTTVILSSTKWSLNAWHYVAISRVSGNIKLFIDGDFIRSVNWSTVCSDGLKFIGRNNNTPSFGMRGYIEELRITVGKGRYNADFTPPATPVTAVFNTAILLQAPYEKYSYGTYLIEGVHISSSLLGDAIEPRLITLTEDVRVNNLFVHNKGTLYIPKDTEAELDIIGTKGLQITSEGSLNIN